MIGKPTRRGWLKGMAAALGGFLAGLVGRHAPTAATPAPAAPAAGDVVSYPTIDLSRGDAGQITDVYRYNANNELIAQVHYDPPGETRLIDIPPS